MGFTSAFALHAPAFAKPASAGEGRSAGEAGSADFDPPSLEMLADTRRSTHRAAVSGEFRVTDFCGGLTAGSVQLPAAPAAAGIDLPPA